MRQLLLALLAGGLLIAAGVLFERQRWEANRYSRASTSELLGELRRGMRDAVLYFELAQRMKDQTRFPDALRLAKEAQRLRPGLAEAFYIEGAVLRMQNRNEEAIPPLRRATELAPKMAPAHLELGQAYNRTAQLRQAVASFRRYVDLEPDDDFGYFRLGATAMSAGMFEVAERSLQRALVLEPKRAVTHIALGNLLLRRDAHRDGLQRALTCYQRAAELDPDDAEPMMLIATVYYRQKRFADAVREFERALRIDATAAEVYYPLGLAYAKLGEHAKSRRCLSIAEVYSMGKEAFVRPGGAISQTTPPP